MAGEHKHPNYMAIFWYLTVLTVLEILVVLPSLKPSSKMVVAVLLCGMAIAKAAIVAAYFMHLRFETRTLGLIAVTPLAIATLLIFVLMPDHFAVNHKTVDKKPAASAPAKN